MGEKYVEIVNAGGGTMLFSAFKAACQAAGVDARLWVRVKHSGLLFTWIDGKGDHYISTSPLVQTG